MPMGPDMSSIERTYFVGVSVVSFFFFIFFTFKSFILCVSAVEVTENRCAFRKAGMWSDLRRTDEYGQGFGSLYIRMYPYHL